MHAGTFDDDTVHLLRVFSHVIKRQLLGQGAVPPTTTVLVS